MKRNIIHTFWMAALPLLLASCQQEELPDMNGTSDLAPLSITVTDGGYASTDKAVTRTVENSYRTEFTAGDECGLYIVRDGAVVYDNIKLTATASANGNALTWQPEADVTLYGGFIDESYFLYYPYQSDMSGKTSVSANDADGFFATLVSGWQPKADQSTYAGYTASDLMTAKGTALKGTDGTLSLSFSMTHRMALVVIEMPPTVYKFTNTIVTIPDYTVASSADFTDGSVQPYGIAPGTYRCIVNPASSTATSITGSYGADIKKFAITPNGLTASSYRTYKVDGAQTVEKSHNLQIGDFLLADGSLVGKDKTLTAGQQAACVGIVFYAGQHPYDQSDYTGSGIGQKNCHGYAVALADATTDVCMWGEYGTKLNLYIDGNKYNPDIDWSGYNYTQTIINHVGGKDKLNATEQAGYPATYYAVVAYETGCPAPAGSSGWFLPSIGQMWEVYQQRSLLTSVDGSSLRDEYWSSSEEGNGYSDQSDRFALSVHVQRGRVNGWTKDGIYCYVRPVLAF